MSKREISSTQSMKENLETSFKHPWVRAPPRDTSTLSIRVKCFRKCRRSGERIDEKLPGTGHFTPPPVSIDSVLFFRFHLEDS